MKQEENHWSKLLTQANERSRKYANLISEGVDSDTALTKVYGSMMATQIKSDLLDIEGKHLSNRVPDDGC